MNHRLLSGHGLLWPVLAVYLLLGGLYAVYTPDWQAPDEPAHYNYISQLADGQMPLMEAGDYDQAYIETIVSSRFDPAYDPGRLTYEDWQPPLYYALGVPAYALSGGSLEALRLVSVLLGAVVVVLAYLVGRRLFPQQPWVGLTMAVVVAFIPQHLAMLGAVNNDSLAELLVAAALLLMVRQPPTTDPTAAAETRRLMTLGLVLGLGFLTKGTVYIMAPVIGLYLLARYRGAWRDLLRAGVLVFVPAALLGLIWWGRNAIVYGDLDILIRRTHDSVVVGQPRTSELVEAYGLAGAARMLLSTTFRSFWGQFGWMAAPLPEWAYGGLRLLTAAAVAGLAAVVWLRWRRGRGVYSGAQLSLPGLVALVTTAALVTALFLGYNLTFIQHQGRYLFPALVPLSLGAALGLGFWLRPLWSRRPAAGYLLPLGLGLALVGLSLFALFRVVVPALSLP